MAEKVAVVTGSNKGLGLSIVKGLCQKFQGIVYLTSRDEKRGLEAVKELNKLGLYPHYHVLDVVDSDSIKSLAYFLKTKHGGIDVLVNNAAILEWDQIYPTYEAAKRNIDTNYRSVLKIEKYLFPLLRDGARVVNISSACGHLSNLKDEKWLKILKSPDLTVEQINQFVDEYLESVRNGTFDKNKFADDGKHAEHRVSKIALTALTMVLQRKYKNLIINAIHPGHVKTDMAVNTGETDPDDAAKPILHLILESSPKVKGIFMWKNGGIVDWLDSDSEMHFQCPW